MKNRHLNPIGMAIAAVLLAHVLAVHSYADEGRTDNTFGHLGSTEAGDSVSDELLISGRMEMIDFHTFTGRIRESMDVHNRLYFNNIFVNLEGDLGPRANFIIEYQPLTSDLYLLGGFLTIAEALEGIGLEDADERKIEIHERITTSIRELDEASQRGNFERATVTLFVSDNVGLKLGRLRNPFGFWDDYSLFRNLSALKTDPITLGVSLRRADQGFSLFGNSGGLSYEGGVLQGENTLANKDLDDFKDVFFKFGTTWDQLDLAVNLYFHDLGRSSEPTHAYGLSYRYRMTYDFTLLGELITMDNEHIDLTTQGFYLQGNYDLSESVMDGLRWNMFFEAYDSDLLDIDLEEGLDYRFAGTYFQGSTGFVYAYNRNIDLGAKILSGADEEGELFLKAAIKIDANF